MSKAYVSKHIKHEYSHKLNCLLDIYIHVGSALGHFHQRKQYHETVALSRLYQVS